MTPLEEMAGGRAGASSQATRIKTRLRIRVGPAIDVASKEVCLLIRLSLASRRVLTLLALWRSRSVLLLALPFPAAVLRPRSRLRKWRLGTILKHLPASIPSRPSRTAATASTCRTASSGSNPSAGFRPCSNQPAARSSPFRGQAPQSPSLWIPLGAAQACSLSDEPGTLYSRTGPPVHHVFHDYQRTEVMIPMRDGVKLHAVILKPADIATPLPILIERTPYGVDGTSRASFFAQRPELARDGYIYVGEDIRGRYKSQGKFVMMRPLADHHDPKAIDESTDAYDTVAWLLKNVPGNNGRVGRGGHQLSGFSGHDGRHRSAPGGQSHLTAGADDRRLDGRRFLSQRRLPPDLRLRLRAGTGIQQGRHRRQLRQRQGRQAHGRLRLFSRARLALPRT